MASKRKRESDDDSWSSPPSKHVKDEEVTRSGRVRKKPSKFKEEQSESHTNLTVKFKPEQGLIPVSVQEMLEVPKAEPHFDPEPEPEPVQEDFFTPTKTELPLSADEETGKSGGGGRTGRARKKSAKVLEMEEFEEAERKSLKKDAGKKTPTATPIQGIPKKIQQKSPPSPVLPVASPPPIPTMKLKTNIMPTIASPVAAQLSPPQKNTSPKSPIAVSAQPAQGEGKASVIKLLLSSPAQSTSSLLSAATVGQISPNPPKPVTASTKKKGKKQDKSAGEVIVTSPVADKGPLKQVIQINKPSKVKQEVQLQEDISVNTLLQMEQKDIPIKVEKVKTPKTPKVKKEKKSPKDTTQVLSPPPPLPSPNVIHVGAMNMAMDIKPELEVVSTKKKKQPKIVIERDEEQIIKDEYELEVPDIGLSEPGEDSFMKMDDSNLVIQDELKMKPKPTKKKKAGKDKAEKLSVADALEMPGSDLVMDFSRMKNLDKKKKSLVAAIEKANKRKRAPTAYTLWCSSTRPKVVASNPGIDFSTISKTLGEMWSALSEKEKMLWKRKAKKAAGKGSTLITTGKGAVPKAQAPPPQIVPVARPPTQMSQKVVSQHLVHPTTTVAMTKQQKLMLDDVNVPLKGFGKEPVDVAAHLKIVGESLSIIGMKLQEHRGLIAVQGSLSVLLDSMLCAVAPLTCLTSILPKTDRHPEQVHLKNVDKNACLCCGYSLELSRPDNSNEFPHHRVWN